MSKKNVGTIDRDELATVVRTRILNRDVLSIEMVSFATNRVVWQREAVALLDLNSSSLRRSKILRSKRCNGGLREN